MWHTGAMALFKLKADAEIDLLTSGEMKDLLTPQLNVLLAIRDLLEGKAETEIITTVETFTIKVTDGAGVFRTPIFRVPQGMSAQIHSAVLWTPTTQAAFTGTVTETIGPAALTINQAGGPLLAIFALTTGYAVGWTFGRAQSPLLRDGETLYAIGQTTTAVSTLGLARLQYTLQVASED